MPAHHPAASPSRRDPDPWEVCGPVRRNRARQGAASAANHTPGDVCDAGRRRWSLYHWSMAFSGDFGIQGHEGPTGARVGGTTVPMGATGGIPLGLTYDDVLLLP